MLGEKKIDINDSSHQKGIYGCARCGSPLFEAAKKFDAGCGFPSFWLHIEANVKLKELDTYGRKRIQLLCKNCGLHLGHLFNHKHTPTQKRYCINASAILFREA